MCFFDTHLQPITEEIFPQSKMHEIICEGFIFMRISHSAFKTEDIHNSCALVDEQSVCTCVKLEITCSICISERW